jgi:hypothetical protein
MSLQRFPTPALPLAAVMNKVSTTPLELGTRSNGHDFHGRGHAGETVLPMLAFREGL